MISLPLCIPHLGLLDILSSLLVLTSVATMLALPESQPLLRFVEFDHTQKQPPQHACLLHHPVSLTWRPSCLHSCHTPILRSPPSIPLPYHPIKQVSSTPPLKLSPILPHCLPNPDAAHSLHPHLPQLQRHRLRRYLLRLPHPQH